MVRVYKLVETELSYANISNHDISLDEKLFKSLDSQKYIHINTIDYTSCCSVIVDDLTKSCKRGFDCDFESDKLKTNITNPVILKLKYKIEFECIYCNEMVSYQFILNDNTIPSNLYYCSKFNKAASQIQKYYKLYKRMNILWEIAEYYMAQKYSPTKILNYINLKD
jgi:hypothetical protein